MQTTLYMLTETSEFMMSFVLVTKNDNVIIVDGGRPEDMPLLKEYVGGRHIAAWILTHAHIDHISGFVSEIERNGGADFDIGTVYYNFPPYSLIDNHNVPDYGYFTRELNETLPSFLAIVLFATILILRMVNFTIHFARFYQLCMRTHAHSFAII